MAAQQPETGLTLNDSPKELQRIQEFNTDAAMMRAVHEVQGAIIVARRFPRNEDQAYQSLMKSCQRSSFAEKVEYSYPRGKKKNEQTGQWEDNIISGPSVYLSREMIRLWGNAQVGTEIIRDDEDSRHIRSFCWDVETNFRKFAESTFRKLVQRKNSVTKLTEWVRPDERDLRELSNKQSAITERNSTLQVLPFDYVEDARAAARETLTKGAAQDPEGTRKRLLTAFGGMNVTADQLEEYLGHPVAQCSPTTLVELRKLYTALNEGQTTWSEVMEQKRDTETTAVSLEQANEWFRLYQTNGHTAEEAAAWLHETFKVKDSRKMPSDGFDKAMEWAGKKVAKAGEVISPNKDAAPEKTVNVTPAIEDRLPTEPMSETIAAEDLNKRLEQLFDIHGTKPKYRESMRRDYAGRMKELVDKLEADLPQD